MGFITKHDHGKKPENKYKNRFVNIIACKSLNKVKTARLEQRFLSNALCFVKLVCEEKILVSCR